MSQVLTVERIAVVEAKTKSPHYQVIEWGKMVDLDPIPQASNHRRQVIKITWFDEVRVRPQIECTLHVLRSS
jgi:hypothetical protein